MKGTLAASEHCNIIITALTLERKMGWDRQMDRQQTVVLCILADHISMGGNVIASVRPSVRPF